MKQSGWLALASICASLPWWHLITVVWQLSLQSDVQTVRSQSCHLLTEGLITSLPAVTADEWQVRCVMSLYSDVFVRRVFVARMFPSSCTVISSKKEEELDCGRESSFHGICRSLNSALQIPRFISINLVEFIRSSFEHKLFWADLKEE